MSDATSDALDQLNSYNQREDLKSYVQRIERLHEDRKAIADDISEIFQEMKSNGFVIPVVKKIIADRAKDPAKLAEFEALMELYVRALEMPTYVPTDPRIIAFLAPRPGEPETGSHVRARGTTA